MDCEALEVVKDNACTACSLEQYVKTATDGARKLQMTLSDQRSTTQSILSRFCVAHESQSYVIIDRGTLPTFNSLVRSYSIQDAS